jgi:hypothetical protein
MTIQVTLGNSSLNSAISRFSTAPGSSVAAANALGNSSDSALNYPGIQTAGRKVTSEINALSLKRVRRLIKHRSSFPNKMRIPDGSKYDPS